ncbi:MAG: TonB-dependent receptor [Acidobacteria bacterium]|nr:TonB-dependent receptor [Acidobacteriota bacterium]
MIQKLSSFRLVSLCLLVFALFSGSVYQVNAQSQALNGQIEGVVTDATGAAIPNASITIKNNETGSERQVTSDESGVYRAPLLPLGTYQIIVEAPNFKRLVREGITLTTGQTATVDLGLETGDVSATVTVTSDTPIADAAKIDVGRVMNTREVQNLPLVSRNPYNYSLLQANVTGRPNSEFGVPRINANGYARRTNYQLDGNNNTQADRAGIRLMPISEIFVSEVQLVTNGFSAEFGNTPGLIMNAVTPAGTNGIHGSASYRFRRTPFYARPIFYNSPNDLPSNKADDLAVAIGGPIIKDRWQYYGGFEYIKRGLAVEPLRLITINNATRTRLINEAGIPAEAFPAAIPTQQDAKFFIIRTDAQLTEEHHLTGRFNYFKNLTSSNTNGQTTTLQRTIDFDDLSYSGAVQLISAFSPNLLNEFRFQYAKRNSVNLPSPFTPTGPSIVITGAEAASFGPAENLNTVSPLETITDFRDNFTLTRGEHTVKFGGSVSRIYDFRRSGIFSRFTFPSINAYLAARSGAAPRGYTSYTASFGDPEFEYKSHFYNAFVQDDWKVTQKLKVNYGLRYDLYSIPKADSSSLFAASQKFKVDRNNFAPRLGVVYGLRDGKYATILRASAGVYYDPPAIDVYARALQNNGNARFFNVTLTPSQAGSPSFPNNLSSANAPIQSIDTISPDFVNLYAVHTNFQIEQSVTNNISFTAGYIHSSGRHIPVYRSINRTAVVGALVDGRPVFNTTASAATRLDPRFNNISIAESVGNSEYNAATFQLNKRFSQGYQFSVNYTLSKSTDDAPEQNLVAASTLSLSDPTNRALDRGPSLADQRHTFVMSFVGRPNFDVENGVLRAILNDNQIGVIATANSGERYNILSTVDLNGDGLFVDRPVGVGRNSGKTPPQYNVDLRYSRFFSFNERFKLEAFAEATNIFNIKSIYQFNNTNLGAAFTGTGANAGVLVNGLPDFRNNFSTLGGATALDSRNFQLGIKFIF